MRPGRMRINVILLAAVFTTARAAAFNWEDWLAALEASPGVACVDAFWAKPPPTYSTDPSGGEVLREPTTRYFYVGITISGAEVVQKSLAAIDTLLTPAACAASPEWEPACAFARDYGPLKMKVEVAGARDLYWVGYYDGGAEEFLTSEGSEELKPALSAETGTFVIRRASR